MSDEQFLPKTGLKDRGWTDALIKRFLRTPDKTAKNPHYKSGPPMLLYAMSRVEEVERSEEWSNAQAATETRRIAGRRSTTTKRKNLLQAVQKITVTVPMLSKDELIDRAREHYNRLWERRGRDDKFAYSDDEDFMQRIAVNYLRHRLTDYETDIGKLHGLVGRDEAYIIIRKKVLEAIGNAYPWLSGECRRQEGSDSGT